MTTGGNRRAGRTRRRYLLYGGMALSGSLLAGCSRDGEPPDGDTDDRLATLPYDVDVEHDLTAWDRYDPEWDPPTPAPPIAEYGYTVLAENLEIPWDLAFAPNGELFITERTGRLLRFDSGDIEPVVSPDSVIDAEAIDPGSDGGSSVLQGGEGGLLGVAVHPTYPDPPLVYIYATRDTFEGRINRVTVHDISAEDPAAESWRIIDEIPAHRFHNGGRITFGPANYLWITTGDADPALDAPDRIADPGTLAGKILRVRPDGTAPADNPDFGADGDRRVFTYGHRNPQGISWLPDGTPVISEHGPAKGDEISVLRNGANYGWPIARNSGAFDSYAGSDFQPPVADAPDWAPSGCVFYTGERLPGLQNRLLVGGLLSQRMLVLTLADTSRHSTPRYGSPHEADWLDDEYAATSTEVFADELGRIRHVEEGPNGYVYAITSNRDGRARGLFPTDRDDVLVRITRSS